jgi:hypothetical protein
MTGAIKLRDETLRPAAGLLGWQFALVVDVAVARDGATPFAALLLGADRVRSSLIWGRGQPPTP